MKAAVVGGVVGIVGFSAALVWLFHEPPVKRVRTVAPQQEPAPLAAARRSAPLLLEDPALLRDLELKGLTAGEVAFGRKARSTADLALNAGWRTLVGTLGDDLSALYRDDARYGVGMRFTHRGFDPSWLVSDLVQFELAAVVNRVDRRAFVRDASGAQHPDACGELRLVYRLAYGVETQSGPFYSRLPMTLNVVLVHPHERGCLKAARALEGDVPALVRSLRQKSVEVNVQTVRWPSTVRPDLGGHAEYVLRVFAPSAGGLVAAPLENTPDTERIMKDPLLRARATAWLTDPSTAADAETGLALLPEELAASRAVSVTPRGLARAQNRPFTRLARALGVESPSREVLRRLDGLSCTGCHQSRSVAGFHVLGAERDAARRVDALAIAHSPHVEDELARRRSYVDALLAGQAPSEARPPAERAAPRGDFGAACGLALFPSWTCAQGLACVAVDDDEVGQCMPVIPGVGDACRPGSVDFLRDRIVSATEVPCPENAVCEGVSVGFPGGMCAASCGGLGTDATCGAIALLTPFNECLARGELFSRCAEHARPAALRACDDARPCRPDYLCAKTATGAGACLPPYFVLQMRVDGHPLTPLPRWRTLIAPP